MHAQKKFRYDTSDLNSFDPFSGSAGIDHDFDDLKLEELEIIEKLRERGSF